MDLRLAQLNQDVRAAPLANSLDVVLATTAGRQAATPTARLATRLAIGRAGPVHGAFDHDTARLLSPREE